MSVRQLPSCRWVSISPKDWKLSICIINQNLFTTTTTISFTMRDSSWTFTQFQIVRFFVWKTFVWLSIVKVMSRELIRYPLIISSPRYGHFMLIYPLINTSFYIFDCKIDVCCLHCIFINSFPMGTQFRKGSYFTNLKSVFVKNHA